MNIHVITSYKVEKELSQVNFSHNRLPTIYIPWTFDDATVFCHFTPISFKTT